MTIVLAVDARGIEQLCHTIPTWQKHRYEMWDMKWLVMFDSSQVSVPKLDNLFCQFDLDPTLIEWSPQRQYETQREKMLTSFVTYAPGIVDTKWWCKVDTDAYALRRSDSAPWIERGLLQPKYSCEPAWLASSWSYTKAKGGGGTIQDWARKLEEFGDHLTGEPRLELERRISGSRINYPRMASWVSIYQTHWTKWLMRRCKVCYGEFKLPVPSQDTTVWYAGARTGTYHCSKRLWAKRHGWGNTSNTERLGVACHEVMNEA